MDYSVSSRVFYFFVVLVLLGACATQSSKEDELSANSKSKVQETVAERLQDAASSLNNGDVTKAQTLYQEVIEELVAELLADEKSKLENQSGDSDKKTKRKAAKDAALDMDASQKLDYLSTAYTGMGVIAHRIRNLDAARDMFNAALEARPQNIEAEEGLALVTLTEGNKLQAKEKLLAIMAKTEDSPRWRTLNALGIVADFEGDYTAAVEYYKGSISAGGPREQAINNQGYSHLMSGDYQQALDLFRDAQRSYPNSERINSNLALTLARLRKYEEAQKTWAKNLDEHEAWNNSGYVAMMNGDLKLARKYLEKAIELAPRYYPAAELSLQHLKQLETQ